MKGTPNARLPRLLNAAGGKRLPIDDDAAGRWCHGTGEHLRYRAFACSVLTDQREHFAFIALETHSLHRMHRSVTLDEVRGYKKGFTLQRAVSA